MKMSSQGETAICSFINISSSGLHWFSPAVSDVPSLIPCPPAEGDMEEKREAPPPSQAESGQEASSGDSLGRLLHLEQSVGALWEQVEAGGRREEQRHQEVLQLYAELQEQQAEQIGAHLERERSKREQVCIVWSETHLRPGDIQSTDTSIEVKQQSVHKLVSLDCVFPGGL